MRVFVCHHLPLVDRRGPMTKQLEKYNLRYEYVTNHPTALELKMYPPRMHTAICSCGMKHRECYNRIAESTEDYNLILEDDAVFGDDFDKNLAEYLSQLPEDFDMFFISHGCGTHMKYNNKNNVMRRNIYSRFGCTRGMDAYFVSNNCAKKLNQYFKENPMINEPADGLINTVARKLGLVVYWGEPTIVHQGSETSMFNSSLAHVRRHSDRN
jgi:GR25 family glycosyltransferase involved in LPS biosynthesis